MQTVYNLNGLTFTKDLIFGWCVCSDDQWIPIDDVNLIGKKIIKNRLSHKLMPDEFKQAVMFSIDKHLKEIEMEELEKNKKNNVVEKPKEQWSRDVDRQKLIRDIANSEYLDDDGSVTYNLGYCVIKKTNMGYLVTDKISRVFKFKDMDEVLNHILKTFW